MKPYWLLCAILTAFAAAFAPATTLAQGANRSFPLFNITCQSPWGGSTYQALLGTIADPSSINISLQDIPITFNCDSSQFYQPDPGKAIWHAHGAACLTIDTPSSTSATQRELSLSTDVTAPKIKFNFAYAGGTSPANAVGNALGNGVGVPYYGFSQGGNGSPTGPALPIGGTSSDFGVYIHASAQQPNNLRSGTYVGSFNWKLYAGTTHIAPPGNSPPLPADCASQVGQVVQTGVIIVKVNIEVSCTLSLPTSGKDIDFGDVTTHELANGIGPITHDLQVRCNNDNPMFITIGAGHHSGGDINQRHMQLVGGSALIKYSLTKPGGGEWGDAPTSGSGYPVPGNFGTTQTVPIEARIPPQSGAFATGDYKDTVQIQLWN